MARRQRRVVIVGAAVGGAPAIGRERDGDVAEGRGAEGEARVFALPLAGRVGVAAPGWGSERQRSILRHPHPCRLRRQTLPARGRVGRPTLPPPQLRLQPANPTTASDIPQGSSLRRHPRSSPAVRAAIPESLQRHSPRSSGRAAWQARWTARRGRRRSRCGRRRLDSPASGSRAAFFARRVSAAARSPRCAAATCSTRSGSGRLAKARKPSAGSRSLSRLEGQRAGQDAAVEFGHDDMHGEVGRSQAALALFPGSRRVVATITWNTGTPARSNSVSAPGSAPAAKAVAVTIAAGFRSRSASRRKRARQGPSGWRRRSGPGACPLRAALRASASIGATSAASSIER